MGSPVRSWTYIHVYRCYICKAKLQLCMYIAYCISIIWNELRKRQWSKSWLCWLAYSIYAPTHIVQEFAVHIALRVTTNYSFRGQNRSCLWRLSLGIFAYLHITHICWTYAIVWDPEQIVVPTLRSNYKSLYLYYISYSSLKYLVEILMNCIIKGNGYRFVYEWLIHSKVIKNLYVYIHLQCA